MPNDNHVSSLHDNLVRDIREMVLDGTLAPGQRVPERFLTEQFGVSRTPLREAIRALASEGTLELLPNPPDLNEKNSLSKLSLAKQVAIIEDYVFLIKVQ